MNQEKQQITVEKVSTLITALEVIVNGNPVSVGLDEITHFAQSVLD